MSVKTIRLGTPRTRGDGLRIGTIRRPPRVVPKTKFAEQDWYEVWFPNLAPSIASMNFAQRAVSPAQWSAFKKKSRAERARPDARHDLDLLATLSRAVNFSPGCYCEREEHCHCSVLRQLLAGQGAWIV